MSQDMLQQQKTWWLVLVVLSCVGGALVLLDPWPLLAADRSKAAPRSAPEEPSIFAPATPLVQS
jgi:hypothetical protein